eukprot:7404691-Alexandrium_andersonii.AAC.1
MSASLVGSEMCIRDSIVLTLPGPAWVMLSLPCAAEEDCALVGASAEVEVCATAVVGGRWHISPPGRPMRLSLIHISEPTRLALI